MFDRLVLNAVMLFLLFVGCAMLRAQRFRSRIDDCRYGCGDRYRHRLEAVHGSAGLSAQCREGRDLHGLHGRRQVSGH